MQSGTKVSLFLSPQLPLKLFSLYFCEEGQLLLIKPLIIMKKYPLPYYAVIFTSIRTEGDNGYADVSRQMMDLARQQEGFLGVESARQELGITVSYWASLEAIEAWKNNNMHQIARQKGREIWYRSFRVRIAKVEREYGFREDLL